MQRMCSAARALRPPVFTVVLLWVPFCRAFVLNSIEAPGARIDPSYPRRVREPRKRILRAAAARDAIEASSGSTTRRKLIGSFFTAAAGAALVSGSSRAVAASEAEGDNVCTRTDDRGNTWSSEGWTTLLSKTSDTAENTASSAVSGLAAGAAVSVSKQLLLHPVDTVKTRLQMRRDASRGLDAELFQGLYDGVLPPLLVGAPSGALFFAAKDACSTALGKSFGSGFPDLITIAAVGLAQFPYWGIRTPAELLKTRSQAGMSKEVGGGVAGVKSVVAKEGVQGLWTGYSSNIVYAFPADAIKFLIYEALKRSSKKASGGAKLGTLEAAALGSAASVVAQAATTPLDVIRTRIMTASRDDPSYVEGITNTAQSITRDEGFATLWAGTTARVARSVLSGAIQFGSYEFVKGLFGVEPRKL